MTIKTDRKIMQELILQNEKSQIRFELILAGKSFILNEVKIVKSQNPVLKPMSRGGVYFSENFIYKIKGKINDISIVPELSKTMLGPNTEFIELEIKTKITIKNKSTYISLFTNLTNSFQKSSSLELYMNIVRINRN